ncbi:voltage-gated potassium channel [Robiginitalea myxolifaciens]|uniref:Voltage-gated potassium channel n=1 Tax=Robiginitalea myxolifaciens TaxID=400055 RepID=A0A1I6G1D6_9FLAO|nr:ion transporter [Robiginitalea myxolifaciens]SFR35877.1 voltage-gated potassium channel [Robiginitalea myxolifaciens]
MNQLSPRKRLWQFLEKSDSKWSFRFHYFIQALILLSLITYAIETLPNLDPDVAQALYVFEIFTVVVFTLEYVLRVMAAPNPWKYIFSFYGIIDLLAILPFYLNNALDWRALRSFRVLRLIRALKMVRYNRALQRFTLAARMVREEIVLFFIITFIVLYLTSAGIYYFENEAQPEAFASIFHSFWWSIVTLTTVGYGDVYPITAGGKIFTFFVLIIGVGIVTVPAGLVAASLSKARDIEAGEDS